MLLKDPRGFVADIEPQLVEFKLTQGWKHVDLKPLIQAEIDRPAYVPAPAVALDLSDVDEEAIDVPAILAKARKRK